MAGTIALEQKQIATDTKELTINWEADADGATVPSLHIDNAGWWITKVITKNGAIAPTDLYDITGETSIGGDDIFDEALLNRSATTTQTEAMTVQIGADGFDLNIGNNYEVSASGIILMMLNR